MRKRKKGGSKPPRTPLISLENCSIVLDGKSVLDEVSFALCEGERWALVGPNGSGKTLFLKLLRGDMWPTPDGRERREYCFDGASDEGPFEAKRQIAYVGPERQDRYVRYGWNHTVTQVVTTGLFDEEIPRTQPSAVQRRRIAALLKQFKLRSLRNRGFLTLSYGQRRRALMARAFAGVPRVLLLDEVFNGLDVTSAKVLRAALHKERGTGSTWILTTHRAQDAPANVTKWARMEKGTLFPLPSPSPMERGSPLPNPLQWRGGKRRNLSIGEVARSAGEGILLHLRNVDLYRDYRLILRDVNWSIRRGEHWAIFGANGSGKSTLLKLLYGDLHPRLGGIIERDGVPFGTPIVEWKQRVGFVSPELQADYFLARDLEEVVVSGLYSSMGLNDSATAADRRAAKRWLEFFELDELAHRGPRAVSYGQMRRALLARAMINDPELLLLDEPCTGLDPDSRAAMLTKLESLAVRGIQLVIAVHERQDLPRVVTNELAIQRDRTVKVTNDK